MQNISDARAAGHYCTNRQQGKRIFSIEHWPSSEQGMRQAQGGGRRAGRDADAPSHSLNSHSHDAKGRVPGSVSGGSEDHLQPRSTRIAVSSAEGGFMTARETARKMYTARGFETDDYLSGAEPDTTKTARDMYTARGFETDDYLSAVEPTPRRRVSMYFHQGGRCCCRKSTCSVYCTTMFIEGWVLSREVYMA